MENIIKICESEKDKMGHMKKNKYVAMCFVPMQEWEEMYDDETAYETGTAFPCLDKPFMGGGK